MTIELYFLRHGLAGQYGDPNYKDDSLRPLTTEGRRKLRQAAQGMLALDLHFDGVLSSPFLRAKQTAQIVAQAYRIPKRNIHLTDNLLPPATIKKLLAEIKRHDPKSQNILLVGHEPHLTELISSLLKSPPLAIDFKKGGLCLVRLEEEAVLQWLLTPTQLGMLAKEKR